MSFEKKIKNKIGYGVVAFVLGIFFSIFDIANAATLKINPSSATLSPGNIATLSIVLNSEGISVNNAEAKILFPADLLEVVSISKGGSIFSLWVEEPTYSNILGTINFSGGIPTPGFNGASGSAISVVVKAKKVGQADLFFSDAAVRANDGLGTDVLNNKINTTLSIIQKLEPVIIEQTPKFVPSSLALQITSLTHPSQESWYRDNNPIFKWKIPVGIDAIQAGIDNKTSGLPTVTLGSTVDERVVKDLKDGIWYFKARAHKDGEWGSMDTYIVRVDNTPPQKDKVIFSYDDSKKILNIEANITDETSGLDYYEIFINDVLVKKISATEFINNTYSLAVDSVGNNTVKMLAVDRAGNSVESSGSFIITPAEDLIPVSNTERQLMYIIIIILITIIILLICAFKFGYHYGVHDKIKMKSALLKGDNKKVLLLLKKRLEKHLQILQNTRHSRILSEEEKEIKEAIEVDLDEVDRAIGEQKVK